MVHCGILLGICRLGRASSASFTYASVPLHLGYPNGGPSSCSQQEEEIEDGNKLQDHGNGTEPGVFPGSITYFLLPLMAVQAAKFIPSVMRQLAEPCAGDYDKRGCANVGYQVEGEEENQLNDLDQAPWLVLGSASRFS